ncbi:MAG: RNA-guided pseudouridylation complex pseudouridine synthase subunit Cbf5 [Candidatus Bilamarchaeum sp.]|jgi:H/ACA ribonucleoprotein complex subunit 4
MSLDLDGKIIIINKPPGHTSHEITTFVKKITGVKRTGHAGTLDPEVSGVLPIALGRATKLLSYIAAKDKTYVGIIKFKIPKTKREIEELFEKFKGQITQTPPKISAVRKVPRKRTIYSLKVLEVKGNIALFETRVDAGTYIRTLCEDIGKLCGGARMEELRRTAVGKISEEQTFTMYELIDALWFRDNKNDETMLKKMINSPEKYIDLTKAHIKMSALQSICNGAQIMVPAIEEIENMAEVRKGQLLALYSGGVFFGVGLIQCDGNEIPKKTHGTVIKTQRIHKPTGL